MLHTYTFTASDSLEYKSEQGTVVVVSRARLSVVGVAGRESETTVVVVSQASLFPSTGRDPVVGGK